MAHLSQQHQHHLGNGGGLPYNPHPHHRGCRHEIRIEPINCGCGNPPRRQLSSPSPSPSPSSTTTTLTQLDQFNSSFHNQQLIHANHYRMLINGDSGALDEEISSSGEDFRLSHLVSELDRSSVLHIAASGPRGRDDIINHIISREQDLLLSPNSRGDLPIHVAAKAGQVAAVRGLLQGSFVCEMLEKGNHNKSTPLHIALENQHEEIAKILLGKCPHTFYFLDSQGFSPLYLAIKAGFQALLQLMLRPLDDVDSSIVENALSAGRSVIHAAIMARNIGFLEDILGSNYSDTMNNSFDERGRTPLSYAAYTGYLDGVRYLLRNGAFPNEAFRPDKDGSFPVHSACAGGHIRVVKELFSGSPNTRWLRNAEGQSALHVAAGSGKADVVSYRLGLGEGGLSNHLINAKDEEGNTPLHLAAQGKHPRVVYALTWDQRVNLWAQNKLGLTALDVAEMYLDVPSFPQRLTWLALRYAGVPRAPLEVNIEFQYVHLDTPNASSGLVHSTYLLSTEAPDARNGNPAQKHRPKRKTKYKERLNTLLMVSILVVTVTYASGFTVPGNYNNNDPNQGMATLAHRWAFKVFVVSDAIAMYASILASVTLIWAHLDDLGLSMLALNMAMPLLGAALASMTLAFTAGLFVVLRPVFWLGLMVLLMGLFSLAALLLFYIPLYSPTSCIRFRFLRRVFHVPFSLMLLACDHGKSQTIY